MSECLFILVYAGRPVSKRVQAFRGATGGKANVDFDRLCFDCRDWRSDCDRNRSTLGSNFLPGQFARFLDVILRRARVWMASCSALDRAEARQARKTRKLNLLIGQCPLWASSGHRSLPTQRPQRFYTRRVISQARPSARQSKLVFPDCWPTIYSMIRVPKPLRVRPLNGRTGRLGPTQEIKRT